MKSKLKPFYKFKKCFVLQDKPVSPMIHYACLKSYFWVFWTSFVRISLLLREEQETIIIYSFIS